MADDFALRVEESRRLRSRSRCWRAAARSAAWANPACRRWPRRWPTRSSATPENASANYPCASTSTLSDGKRNTAVSSPALKDREPTAAAFNAPVSNSSKHWSPHRGIYGKRRHEGLHRRSIQKEERPALRRHAGAGVRARRCSGRDPRGRAQCSGFQIWDGEFKLILPYRPPFVLGHDVAGVVVRAGSKVRQFKPGDEAMLGRAMAGSGHSRNSLP